MGKADLHIHSRCSDGYATVEQILEYTERRTDLDVIAITDHDCIDGALRAAELAAKRRHRFQVMTGAEISTRDGHLLALNIRALVPAALSMAETIQAVHGQGGLAIVAHPLSRWCPSATLDTLLSLRDQPPDGIEVHNASFAGLGSNARAMLANQLRLHWPVTGSSDAHTLNAIGSSLTVFPGTTIPELIGAIRRGDTHATAGYWPTLALANYSYRMVRSGIRSGWSTIRG